MLQQHVVYKSGGNALHRRSNLGQQHHVLTRRAAYSRHFATHAVDATAKHVSIWWDFDNLPPCGGMGAAVVMAERIKDAVLKHGGVLSDLRVYGNTITMTKHDLSMRLLAGIGATCIRVGTKRESVDLAILSDVYWWSQHMRSQGTLVLVSSDHDFAPMLAMARSMGCTTIAVGMFEQRRRNGTGGDDTAQVKLLTDQADVVLQWCHTPGSACVETELQTLQQCWKGLGHRTVQRIPARVGNVTERQLQYTAVHCPGLWAPSNTRGNH